MVGMRARSSESRCSTIRTPPRVTAARSEPALVPALARGRLSCSRLPAGLSPGGAGSRGPTARSVGTRQRPSLPPGSRWRAPPNKSTQERLCLPLYRLSYMVPRDHGRIRTGDLQVPITLPLRLGFAHGRARRTSSFGEATALRQPNCITRQGGGWTRATLSSDSR